MSIHFINNNQIKIEVILNHNIDNSIKILFQKSIIKNLLI